MNWYYNLKIAAKLVLGFFIVALIAGVVGAVGIINLNTSDKANNELYNQNVAGLVKLSELSTAYQQFRVKIHDLMLDEDESDKDVYLVPAEDSYALVELKLKEYGETELDSNSRALYNELQRTLKEYGPVKDKVINLVLDGKTDEAREYAFGEGAPYAAAVENAINEINTENVENARAKSDNNAATAANALTTMFILVIVGFVAAISLGVFISRTISDRIKKLVDASDKLTVGDTNVDVRAYTTDEIGNLAGSLRKMIDNIQAQALVAERLAAGDLTVEVEIRSENDLLGRKLYEIVEKNNEVLTNIASASEQVAVGARQISDSSIALSQGATEQASSIEQLTASLEEISSQTKLNAENANQANELAENAKINAVQGNTRMNEMLKSMEEINEASASISKIIKVIDEIAFQTNILALNAAVEAARAGQHGKGFAVVAEEVRNLAARAANAAKETTEMIEGSIKKAEGGTKIAKDTAEALHEIVNGIDKVANLVGDIAIASNEQATGIAQINQGVMQVSQVVQTNSATSEEGAAASEELSSQALLLKETVGKFKLKQHVKSYSRFD